MKWIDTLVDRFLAWPLPASVCSDLCATQQGAPHRSGTTLLSAVEAKQMLEYLLADLTPPAVWSRERPTVEGYYFYRWNGQPHTIVQLAQVDTGSRFILERVHEDGTFRPLLPSTLDEWAGPLRPPVEGPG